MSRQRERGIVHRRLREQAAAREVATEPAEDVRVDDADTVRVQPVGADVTVQRLDDALHGGYQGAAVRACDRLILSL